MSQVPDAEGTVENGDDLNSSTSEYFDSAPAQDDDEFGGSQEFEEILAYVAAQEQDALPPVLEDDDGHGQSQGVDPDLVFNDETVENSKNELLNCTKSSIFLGEAPSNQAKKLI